MTVWDTSTLPVADQLPFWHEVVCDAFVPLRSRPHGEAAGFAARVESRPMGTVSRALIDSPAQLTEHGRREIGHAAAPYHFVNLQVRGRCLVRQGGRELVAGPGDCVVLDTTEPYSLDFDTAWTMLSYRIPHADLIQLMTRPEQAQGTVLRGTSGLGRLVGATVRSLWHVDAEARTMHGLERTLLGTLGVALDERASASEERAAVLRSQALNHVLTNLGDPAVCASSVADALGISTRRLHTLFEEQPRSFAATVRWMRLERCARLLSDPADHTPITEIGASHGFPDPAGFSRAFRREYGTSPRQWRDHARVSAGATAS